MRMFIAVFFAISIFCLMVTAADEKRNVSKEAKSFGQPFDEIVVESSLTVRRKNGARQAKSPSTNTELKRVKRRFPRF